MSDTKALQDVVEKALANWGNGEAQEAFEAIMRQLRGADDLLATGLMAAVSRIDAEMRDRAQRAEADNAALMDLIQNGRMKGKFRGDGDFWMDGEAALSLFAALDERLGHASSIRPGAALLEELEGLRRRVGAFDEAADYDKVRTMPASDEAHAILAALLDKPHHALPSIQRLLDERQGAHNAALVEDLEAQKTAIATLEKAVSIAHDAALEEAAKVAGDRVRFTSTQKFAAVDAKDLSKSDYWFHRQQEADHLEEAIRALKKTGQGA